MELRECITNGVIYDSQDKNKLAQLFEEITQCAKEWNSAANAQTRITAQHCARDIKRCVDLYELAFRDSSRRAQEMFDTEGAINSPGYKALLQRKRKEASLFYAFHRVQPFNPLFNAGVLEDITAWIADVSSDNPIFWLRGPAQSGKSAIAYFFSQRCYDEGALAASYRFTDSTNFDFFQNTFIPNVAIDFTDYLGTPYKMTLASVARRLNLDDPAVTDDFLSKPLTHQLRQLLVPSFNDLPEQDKKPLLIVLDGIEKCGDEQGYTLGALLDFVAEAVARLPICFFVSSSTDSPKASRINNFFTKSVLCRVEIRETIVETPTTPKARAFPSDQAHSAFP